MRLIGATLSHAGGREENQDHCDFRLSDSGGCFVLADGLGGHRGGEVASHIAVDAALDLYAAQPGCSADDLMRYFEGAQAAVVRRQAEEGRLSSMRTTLVMLAVEGNAARWAHVGDSRLYLFQDGAVTSRTQDHSVPQAMKDAGDIGEEDIRGHEDRNRLLRALGKENDLRPTLLDKEHALKPGDAFLLCTDGFWEYVFEPEMEIAYAKAAGPTQWLAAMERLLVSRAEPDHDNYSALGVFVE